jgi:N-acetylmuramoyl-L-alanine amidase
MPFASHSLIARRRQLSASFVAVLLLTTRADAARVPLVTVQCELGWTSCVVRSDCIDIGDGTNRLRIFPGLRRAEINGVAVWLHDVAEPDGVDSVTLDRQDVEGVLKPILQSPPPLHRKMRVMLDPGHGGEDGGAFSAKPLLKEKDFVLDLALRIGHRLEASGVTVGFTRMDDGFLTLTERTATATVWRADALVSLHANFAENSQASGRETYVLPLAGYAATGESRISDNHRVGNGNDVFNTLLGHSLHRQLPGRLHGADRGLRRARFQILRQATCPAALVEFGFLSNSKDVKLLASGWYRDRLARAVADGLLDYSRYLTTHPTNGVPASGTASTNETASTDLELVIIEEDATTAPATNGIPHVHQTTNSPAATAHSTPREETDDATRGAVGPVIEAEMPAPPADIKGEH